MSPVEINQCVVHWDRALLVRNGQEFAIDAKLLSLLGALVEAQGKIVSHQQLLEKVWPDTIVAPNTLQQSIAQLRKLLGDDAKQQAAIKTHPKLGYSIISNKSQPQTTTAQTPNTRVWLTLLVTTILVVSAILLMLKTNHAIDAYQKPTATHVTINNELVLGATYAKNIQSIFYIVDVGDAHIIRKQTLNSPNFEDIAKGLSLEGGLTVSANGDHLYYSEIVLLDTGKKCIRLVGHAVATDDSRPITDCDSGFALSPQWQGPQHLLFLKSSEPGQRFLYSINLNSLSTTKLLNEPIDSFDVNKNQLATISGNHIAIYDLVTNNASLTARYSLKHRDTKGVTLLEDGLLATWSTNEIRLMPLDGSKSKVIELDKQINLKALRQSQTGKFVAISGKTNWNVGKRNLYTNESESVAQSVFQETHGQFYHDASSIVLLSNRSGSQQIWLAKSDGLTQLTDSELDVNDFIIDHNNQQIIYIAGTDLYRLDKNNNVTSYDNNFTPLTLLQTVGDRLLLKATVNNVPQVLEMNLDTGVSESKLLHDVDWAQRVSDTLIISNTSKGKLVAWENGQSRAIESLQPIKLQWRYLWRADPSNPPALYFQDKNLQVWRYDPITDSPEVIGHFDENALFMTDYDAENRTMLSNNIAHKQGELLVLDLIH